MILAFSLRAMALASCWSWPWSWPDIGAGNILDQGYVPGQCPWVPSQDLGLLGGHGTFNQVGRRTSILPLRGSQLSSRGGPLSVQTPEYWSEGLLGSEGEKTGERNRHSKFPESMHDTCPGPSPTSFSNGLEGSGPR